MRLPSFDLTSSPFNQADFIVGGDLKDLLLPEAKLEPQTLYVLPCFRATDPAESGPWPKTKAALIEWKASGRVQAYGELEDW